MPDAGKSGPDPPVVKVAASDFGFEDLGDRAVFLAGPRSENSPLPQKTATASQEAALAERVKVGERLAYCLSIDPALAAI